MVEKVLYWHVFVGNIRRLYYDGAGVNGRKTSSVVGKTVKKDFFLPFTPAPSYVIQIFMPNIKMRWFGFSLDLHAALLLNDGLTMGVPFVTSILLLTEANFVQQKSLLSNKSNFVYDKITFV